MDILFSPASSPRGAEPPDGGAPEGVAADRRGAGRAGSPCVRRRDACIAERGWGNRGMCRERWSGTPAKGRFVAAVLGGAVQADAKVRRIRGAPAACGGRPMLRAWFRPSGPEVAARLDASPWTGPVRCGGRAVAWTDVPGVPLVSPKAPGWRLLRHFGGVWAECGKACTPFGQTCQRFFWLKGMFFWQGGRPSRERRSSAPMAAVRSWRRFPPEPRTRAEAATGLDNL
jgi:hypothetical protein